MAINLGSGSRNCIAAKECGGPERGFSNRRNLALPWRSTVAGAVGHGRLGQWPERDDASQVGRRGRARRVTEYSRGGAGAAGHLRAAGLAVGRQDAGGSHDIRIELHPGNLRIKLEWPQDRAAECAAWR